jgi:hypothetical protein
MLIGYVRVSKSDGTRTLAPQRDAMLLAGVDPHPHLRRPGIRSGDPVADTDVTEAVWAPLDALDGYSLWSEAHRVIAIARRLVE